MFPSFLEWEVAGKFSPLLIDKIKNGKSGVDVCFEVREVYFLLLDIRPKITVLEQILINVVTNR
jgi:hypothetical protein